MSETGAAALGVAAGFAAGAAALRALRTERSPVRTNVNGQPVRVFLGTALVLGALGGLAASAAFRWADGADGGPSAMDVAVALCLVVMAGAGRWDDRRGDEPARGFSGHLAATRSGRLTGGLVKIAAGGVCGVGAGLLVGHDPAGVVVTAAIVALAGNLVNLFDRAPGRAGKISLAVVVPLIFLGDPSWAAAAGGLVGALGVILPWDLSERGMLGDEGANPLGAVAGLGLAASLPGAWRLAVLALLVLLNVASERWSFSAVIARTPVLSFLDRLGRE